MSTARKVLSNTASPFLGRVMTAVLSVIILKLITNYLGTSGYGEYTTIYEMLGFFAIFADLGIYTVAVHEMSRNQENISRVIGNIMGLRLVLITIMMILAAVFVYFMPQYNDHIRFGMMIAGITTFFNVMYGTITSVLQIYYKMHYAAIFLVVGKILTMIYMIIAIMYFAPLGGDPFFDGIIIQYGIPNIYANNLSTGFYHILASGIIGTSMTFLLTSYFAHKLIDFRYRFDLDFWKRVIFKAAPGGIALILNNVYFRIDVVLLSLVLPMKTSMMQTGIYGVAIRILDLLIVIPVFFMNSVLPILTRLYTDNLEKFKKVIQYSFDFLFMTGLPILVGGFFLAKGIIRLISSAEFVSTQTSYGSDVALQILLFALFATFLNILFCFLFIVDRKPLKLLKITVSAVIINVMGSIFGILWWGFIGAAVFSIISQVTILMFAFYYSKKYIGFSLQYTNICKSLFACLLMGGTIYLIMSLTEHKYIWVAAGFSGVLVYLSGLWLTGAINKEILQVLKKEK